MIRLQVIDLLPEQQRPHVLAEKLDHVEGIHEARPISREPIPT